MKLKPTCDTDGARQCWNPCLVSIAYAAWTTVLAHWMALFWTHREEGIQTQTAYTDSRMITYTCMRAICVGACLALCRNYECNCRLLLLLFVLLCLHALIMSVPKAWKAEAFRAATKRECPRAARQALVFTFYTLPNFTPIFNFTPDFTPCLQFFFFHRPIK